MPELPEVQTVVNYLHKKLPGKTIDSVESPNLYTRVLENGTLAEYHKFLIGKKIETIGRKGKFIILELDFGFLLFHLRMTGRIILEKPKIINESKLYDLIILSLERMLYFKLIK